MLLRSRMKKQRLILHTILHATTGDFVVSPSSSFPHNSVLMCGCRMNVKQMWFAAVDIQRWRMNSSAASTQTIINVNRRKTHNQVPPNHFFVLLNEGKVMSRDFTETLTPTGEMHRVPPKSACEILHLWNSHLTTN